MVCVTQPIIQKSLPHNIPTKPKILKQHILEEIHTLLLQQPSTPKNTNFPFTKRLRPSDSEQTKMSIDAIRLKQIQPYYYEL